MSDDLARRLRNLQESLRDGDIDEADYAKGLDGLRQRFGATAVDALIRTAPQPEATHVHTVSMADTSQAGVAVAGHVYGNIILAEQLHSVTTSAEELTASKERLSELPTDSIPEPEDTLPPGSWMGQLSRNRQFVGRMDDLKALATLLKGSYAVAVNQAQSAVASGIGGIGKTQLAVEFAYHYGRYFAGVFWLSFAQADTIPTEFARLGGAGQLQLFTEAAGLKLEEQVNLVKARLACGLPYLLIFDNCEQPDLVRQHHPGGAARVLITSRNPDWPGDLGVQRHTLDVLQRAESIALLRQHRPDLSDADADALAVELGDLPLALHLAGRFLARYGKILTVEKYLTELRSPRIFERLLLREWDGRLPTGHSRDVARTFALSYERLVPQDVKDAVALKLLVRATHLAPGEVVPAALLRATLETNNEDLEAQLVVEEGLERLISLGLLEREGDNSLRIHRLVGAYVRQISSDGKAQEAVEQALLQAMAGRQDDSGRYELQNDMLAHLRWAAGHCLERTDILAVTLTNNVAYYLEQLGDYAAARPLYERALAVCEATLGSTHPKTATSLNNLAGLLEVMGNYAAARPLYERALAVCEATLGSTHPKTATSLNNLAGLLEATGDYAAARPLYERALTIRVTIRVFGSCREETAI